MQSEEVWKTTARPQMKYIFSEHELGRPVRLNRLLVGFLELLQACLENVFDRRFDVCFGLSGWGVELDWLYEPVTDKSVDYRP